jgi:hypothetical protein
MTGPVEPHHSHVLTYPYDPDKAKPCWMLRDIRQVRMDCASDSSCNAAKQDLEDIM